MGKDLFISNTYFYIVKIITVNLPVSHLEAIETLVGNTGLYPSRSELIRVAVRDFLIHELESAKTIKNFQNEIQLQKERKEKITELPYNDKEIAIVGDKTYHIRPTI